MSAFYVPGTTLRTKSPVGTQTERSLSYPSPGPGGEDPPQMSNKVLNMGISARERL